MGPLEYLERMFGTAGGYGYLSVNAFNAWALVGVEGEPSLAAALRWNDDTVGLLGPIPGVAIGAALLAAGFAWGVVRGAVRDDRWTLIVAVTFLAIAFFILPTRVHERYIFPAVALMPLLAVVSGRWAVALLLLERGCLHQPPRHPHPAALRHRQRRDPAPGGVVPDAAAGHALSPAADGRGPVGGVAAASRAAHQPRRVRCARGRARSRPAQGSRRRCRARQERRPRPACRLSGRPCRAPATQAQLSLLDHLVARLSWGSLRRDRSALLRFEPGGRIDRLDLLVLVVLVVLTLTLRGFRLDQPARMYFDEVYHARTAAEFLQQWEYGEPHDIYEFTHPHLAKYAMAWGIRIAGGNEVTGTADLGMPAEDAAIEARWAPDDDRRRRNGDRLYVAGGDRLGVYDLATRELLDELPLAASVVAVDSDDHLLYAADAAGRIYRFDTTWFDAQRFGADADPSAIVDAATPFSFGPGAPVQQLLVTDTALVAVTLGSIASFDADTGELLSERLAVGIEDVVELPWAERLIVDTRELPDRQAAADLLASVLDDDPARLADLLTRDGFVTITAWPDADTVDGLTAFIDEGRLPGAALESAPLLAVADAAGVDVLDVWSLDPLETIATDEPVTALALAEPDSDEPIALRGLWRHARDDPLQRRGTGAAGVGVDARGRSGTWPGTRPAS